MRAFLLQLVPDALKRAIKRRRRARLMERGDRLDLGVIDRGAPLDAYFGLNRGTPVDRVYIESFLSRHADAITGHVIEVGDDRYTSRFGRGVTGKDVLHYSPSDEAGRSTGDLCDPDTLPPDTFDAIIAVQTLQYVVDPLAALRNCRQALREGGALLLTVPCLSPIIDDGWPSRWLFTPAHLRGLLAEAFAGDDVLVESAGNALAVTCFVNGIAYEEVDAAKLKASDPTRPIVLLAKATRATAP